MLFIHNSSEPTIAFGQAWREEEAQEEVTLVKMFVEVDERQLALFDAELVEYVEGREDEEWHARGQW
jgi:hypothetical protein